MSTDPQPQDPGELHEIAAETSERLTDGVDPDAPGAHVDDDTSAAVAEPNEPA